MTAQIIPTHRPWWNRLWRALYARYLEWCEESIADELAEHRASRIPMGPQYLANAQAQQERLRVQIALLRNT